ncbi:MULTISPECIES: aspartate aminotransferase [Arthrospira]|jgi:LL-diaminopimelate aminotransferase|uniref:Aminotransferase n=1 Tax=Limnospira platensis NIES-46 TaxID=1236695 RepID=A0A5M3TEV5_LIMPL|nr:MULTISPECIES: aspartate aminotransferase [Arthrospira]AMW28959.1 LL-diaminopimelate aminotransferase [Arthrospira platensis YZ]KDR56498.1 aminotransferase [Arthrospira platensis str. Paraca]MBD2668460.1 aspartate aminotransferase [Arthrospira platensis FACHB-439]MBD2711657.1 aspartate aminotransferase [Arthrospira platensis FACHB-835]MDF2212755.1 aspartate aminotransferase [Arthrospira platensis NCB002]MDT9185215.1 aspartate aminotransferase [Limnospira sp. PMC 289.06]MDT9297431.1 asparta
MNLDWITPADRVKQLPPYVFARLDELKAHACEQGLDLIDLGMGNPDGPTPEPVVEAAIAALRNSANHGYPPFEGTASFRAAITRWYHRRYGVNLDPNSEALPLLGSKEGLTHLALAYVNPQDVVLSPDPAYPAHFRGPLISGGDVYKIRLKPENDWIIDLADIPDHIADRAKILYFNYPNNPTGATAPREFFEDLVAFAHKHQILLVHDLCYAELAFDGYQPTSLLEIPGGKEIGVEFHTMSKTYNMAGWRVGFVVGNSRIIQGLRTLKTNLDYGLFAALQSAAETALNLPDSYLEEVQNRYRTRRDFLVRELAELGWNIPKPKAAMYLWAPCPVGMTSTDFALSVLQQTGVVVTPGNAFGAGGEGYVRISLIADCDRLAEAVKRLKEANIGYQRQMVATGMV